MICKRCNIVMGTGTRYEWQGRDRPFARRYYECKKCKDRVYTNAPNFQEILVGEYEKCRNK